MVKWQIIYKTWPQKKPKFWSVCNWRHRFSHWYKDLYGKRGIICKKCRVWWKLTDWNIRIFKSKWYRKFMCNKLFWIIVDMPCVFICTILDWIKRDREWCKSKKIGFKKIWKSNWKMYIELLEDNRDHLLDDENFKEYSKLLLGDEDEDNS